MKFPVNSLLAGNLAFSETSSQLTPPSRGESSKLSVPREAPTFAGPLGCTSYLILPFLLRWWVAGMVQTPHLARRLQEKGGPREPATRWVLPMQVAGSESQEIKISVVNYAG